MQKMRRRLALLRFLFIKKTIYELKASGVHLSFNISIALNLEYKKKKKKGKLYKTLEY